MAEKRALTLATLGLLSGLAVTVATDGIIQPDGGTPVTPTTPAYYNAGGDPNQSVFNKQEQQILADDDEVLQLITMIVKSGALD